MTDLLKRVPNLALVDEEVLVFMEALEQKTEFSFVNGTYSAVVSYTDDATNDVSVAVSDEAINITVQRGGEHYITANLKLNDDSEWETAGDGSFILGQVTYGRDEVFRLTDELGAMASAMMH